MALTDKLTDIADAIRAKSGKTAALTLDEMPAEIEALSIEQLKASEYPSYVHSEVIEMVNKVRSVQKNDSIVFLAMSDSHYPADQTATSDYASNKASSVQANQAAKALAYMLDIDFFAHLGDVSAGADATTPDMLKSQIEGFLAYLHEANSDLPVFLAIGNHDTGWEYHDAVADGNIHTMAGEYLYKNFTAHSASEDTVMGSAEYGGYCYRDFADKKLRVFLLNTSEKLVGAQIDQATYGAQRVWFANALIDLNSKSDAADWGFIILSHYPADYGRNMNLSELLKAYVEGASFTITDPVSSYYVGDETNQAVDFSGKNGAKFIAQFHGHVHNFKTSKLHSYATGSAVQYDAHRVCIPNAQFNRENYYTTVGSYTDIDFSEDASYPKTANSANGTSFVVNVINPSEEKIYSFCYGAGYDRVIGYGSVAYYSVSRTLTNVTTNNTLVSVEEGKSYSEVITLNSGCDMKTISVTMGGVDISSTAITTIDGGYQIDIPEVTGNVVITAKAQARPNFTNLVPYSINADGTDYNVDGDGYDDDLYLTSSGTMAAMSGYVSTGFIPVSAGAKTIRVAGDGISFDDVYCRIAFFDSNFALLTGHPATNMGTGDYQGTVTEEDATAMTWTIDNATKMPNQYNAPYILVTAKGKGENLIVTVNEEITYGGEGSGDAEITHAVIQNLSNVTSSNTSAGVTSGGSFSTTLTANSGCELGTVVVTMGGLDITSSAYSNGVVSIPSVTGTVTITATAQAAAPKYTNQLPISTDTDGTVFNGVGYKADSYLSSGNVGTKSGYYATGFIPVKAGDTIYFKNCTIQADQSYHRFCFYKSDKTYFTIKGMVSSQLPADTKVTIVYGDDGNVASITFAGDGYYATNDLGYIRFCCSYLGADSIVTVNEPIE